MNASPIVSCDPPLRRFPLLEDTRLTDVPLLFLELVWRLFAPLLLVAFLAIDLLLIARALRLNSRHTALFPGQ
jgi:lipopolysaccharide export LptBFGC system permease protein LptF